MNCSIPTCSGVNCSALNCPELNRSLLYTKRLQRYLYVGYGCVFFQRVYGNIVYKLTVILRPFTPITAHLWHEIDARQRETLLDEISHSFSVQRNVVRTYIVVRNLYERSAISRTSVHSCPFILLLLTNQLAQIVDVYAKREGGSFNICTRGVSRGKGRLRRYGW